MATSSPRRPRNDAFNDLILKLSYNMTEGNAESLVHLSEVKWPSGHETPKLTPLRALKKLNQCGVFSSGACAELHSLLERIYRCDLAELVCKFMHTYGETNTATETESAYYETEEDPETEHRTKKITRSVIPVERVSSGPPSLSNSSHFTATYDSSEDDGGSVTGHAQGTATAALAESSSQRRASPERAPPYATQSAEYQSMPDVRSPAQNGFGLASASSQLRVGSQELVDLSSGTLHSFVSSTSSLPSQAHPSQVAPTPTHININIGSSNAPLDIRISDSNSNQSPPPAPGLQQQPATKNSTAQNQQLVPEIVGPVPSSEGHSKLAKMRATKERMSVRYSALYETTIAEEQADDKRERASEHGGSVASNSACSTPQQAESPKILRDKAQGTQEGGGGSRQKGLKSDAQGSPSPKGGKRWPKFRQGKPSRAKKTRLLTTEETWSVRKAPIGQFIWDYKHHLGHLKFQKDLPINIDCGELNPSLSFLLYPFGLFEDRSVSMTLLIKLNIPDDCPPLLPTDGFTLTWEVHTQATRTLQRTQLTCSKKPLKIQFGQGFVYIHKFLPHDIIKPCECSAFEISVSTSYCCQSSAGEVHRCQDLGHPITPKQTEGTVTLDKLLNFKIAGGRVMNLAREIAPNHHKFCQSLLSESTHKKLVENSLNNGKDASGLIQEVLKQWLEGAGRQPVQWGTLVETLRAAELTSLATRVEQSLQLNT